MLINLKSIRTSKGLTLKRLSYKTGISKSYLWELENLIKINPNYKILKKLTNALNTTIEELEKQPK